MGPPAVMLWGMTALTPGEQAGSSRAEVKAQFSSHRQDKASVHPDLCPHRARLTHLSCSHKGLGHHGQPVTIRGLTSFPATANMAKGSQG